MSQKTRGPVYHRVLEDAMSLSEKIERLGRKRCKDLTVRQLMFLGIVNTFETNPSLGDIAQKAFCSHQNAKTLLSALEKKGYLEFYPDEKDQRILRVGLTDKGTALAVRANAETSGIVAYLDDTVTREHAETFTYVIDHLIRAFEESFDVTEIASSEPETPSAL